MCNAWNARFLNACTATVSAGRLCVHKTSLMHTLVNDKVYECRVIFETCVQQANIEHRRQQLIQTGRNSWFYALISAVQLLIGVLRHQVAACFHRILVFQRKQRNNSNVAAAYVQYLFIKMTRTQIEGNRLIVRLCICGFVIRALALKLCNGPELVRVINARPDCYGLYYCRRLFDTEMLRLRSTCVWHIRRAVACSFVGETLLFVVWCVYLRLSIIIIDWMFHSHYYTSAASARPSYVYQLSETPLWAIWGFVQFCLLRNQKYHRRHVPPVCTWMNFLCGALPTFILNVRIGYRMT